MLKKLYVYIEIFLFSPKNINYEKIILTAAAVFAFSFVNEQEAKFGAKAILNMATLTGDVEDASSLIGYQIGGFAEIKNIRKICYST